MRKSTAGWTAVEVLLAMSAVSAMVGIGFAIALKHHRAALVAETVEVVAAMIQHGELAASLYAEDPSGTNQGYAAGVLAMGAAPEYWSEPDMTQYRNPLGEGEFWGMGVGGTSDGASQFAFWFLNVPRWSCPDLVKGLSEYGFVQRGSMLNRSADGSSRVPLPAARIATACNATAATPTIPTIILVGPAPN